MEADTFRRFKSLLVRYMDRKDMEGYGPDTGKSGSLVGQQKILYHFNGDLRTFKKKTNTEDSWLAKNKQEASEVSAPLCIAVDNVDKQGVRMRK